MTRLMTERSKVVIVSTRWHEDDLVGRLTDPMNPCFTEEECSRWKVINLPAFAGDNDPLKRKEGEVLWSVAEFSDFVINILLLTSCF